MVSLTSRVSDSSTPLLLCLPNLSEKKFLLIPNLNISGHNLRQHSLVTWEKRLIPSRLQPPFRELQSDKVTPEPPSLQAKHPQHSLTGLVPQILHQLRCPSLHSKESQNIRKHFVTVMVTQHGHRFPEKLQGLRPWRHTTALRARSGRSAPAVPTRGEGLDCTLMTCAGPSHPQPSVIL